MRTWQVASIDRVIDGDTVRLTRRAVIEEINGIRLVAEDVEPIPVRLIHVDTPERGEDGWGKAQAELDLWLEDGEADGLTLIEAGRDNFGRLLADIRDTNGDSASMYMITERGWPTWSETR